jgi:hypothetical protein
MYDTKKDRIINHILLTLFCLPSLYMLNADNYKWFGVLWFGIVIFIFNKFYQFNYELEEEYKVRKPEHK